jgi:hypothetical protein
MMKIQRRYGIILSVDKLIFATTSVQFLQANFKNFRSLILVKWLMMGISIKYICKKIMSRHSGITIGKKKK